MKMKSSILTLIVLAVSVMIIGCKKKKSEEIEKVIPVEVYIAEPDSISSYIKLTGGIEAQNDAFVYSKVSEKMTSVNVKPGDRVKAGQILAVQYNKAALQGKLVAEAGLKSAKIQLQAKQDDFNRMKNLLARNAISKQQFDMAKSQYDVAQATLDQASASMGQANVQYENTILRAPFDGRVGMVYFDVNVMVPAGQQVIKIVNANTVKAKLRVPAVDIQKLSVGQLVVASFPSLPDTQLVGTVEKIDEAVDPLTRTLEIEVRLNNQNNLLKSGLFGEFLVEISRRVGTVVVSEMTVLTHTKILTDQKGVQKEKPEFFIYVVNNGRAEKRDIVPGLFSGGYMELSKGTSFGDSIIVAGQNIVKNGDSLRVVTQTGR